MSKVVVLGAGISGLTSSLALVEAFPSKISELVIVASEFPGDYHAHDYTSPWAGANWASFASELETEQVERDKITYKKLIKLAEEEPKCGITKFPIKVLEKKEIGLPWYIKQNFVYNIKHLNDEEIIHRKLDPTKYIGYEFTTITITPNQFTNFLIAQLKSQGAQLKRVKRLDDLEDIVDVMGYTPDLLVNYTGVIAGKLLSKLDPKELNKVCPVKGVILQIYEDLPFQMIIEHLPSDDEQLPGQFLNVFPRGEGGCIMGGVFKPDDWTKDMIDGLSDSIIRVAKKHIPEFSDVTVFNSYTALRPGRKGGVRIETSIYDMVSH